MKRADLHTGLDVALRNANRATILDDGRWEPRSTGYPHYEAMREHTLPDGRTVKVAGRPAPDRVAASATGVLAEVHHYGGCGAHVEILKPSQIASTWAEHQQHLADAAEAGRRVKEAADREAAQRAEQLRTLQATAVTLLRRDVDLQYVQGRIAISPTDLAAILAAATKEPRP